MAITGQPPDSKRRPTLGYRHFVRFGRGVGLTSALDLEYSLKQANAILRESACSSDVHFMLTRKLRILPFIVEKASGCVQKSEVAGAMLNQHGHGKGCSN
jgi:hypothetical protein